MRRTIFVGILVLLNCWTGIQLLAQSSNAGPQAPQVGAGTSPRLENPGVPITPKAPDMVCFGYYPNWSVQLRNGEARYLGYNEPDRYFAGAFYWVPDDKVWSWHRTSGRAPADTEFGLSATIQQAACRDEVLK